MGKKYLVEQVDEEKKKDEENKEEPSKESLVRKKEQDDSGIPQKDIDTSLKPKVEEPSEQSGQKAVIPNDPLENAKKLTEQIPPVDPVGGQPAPTVDANGKILEALSGIGSRLEAIETKVGIGAGTEQVQGAEEEDPVLEPRKETAIGNEAETPSGPSYGAKTDTSGGGIPAKDKDPKLTGKVKEPSEQSGQSDVIPDQPLEQVKQLTENLSGRKVPVGGGGQATYKEHGTVEGVMKEYVKGNQREVY